MKSVSNVTDKVGSAHGVHAAPSRSDMRRILSAQRWLAASTAGPAPARWFMGAVDENLGSMVEKEKPEEEEEEEAEEEPAEETEEPPKKAGGLTGCDHVPSLHDP
eukprot:3021566-Rhodomonas_salina.2